MKATKVGSRDSPGDSLAIQGRGRRRHRCTTGTGRQRTEARALTSPGRIPGDPRAGKPLQRQGTCFNCHGKDGDGNGLAVSDSITRNFHTGILAHARKAKSLVSRRSVGTAWVAWRATDGQEIWALQYERSLRCAGPA